MSGAAKTRCLAIGLLVVGWAGIARAEVSSLEVSGDPPMVRFTRSAPQGSEDVAVVVLRRPGRVTKLVFPAYFTVQELAQAPMDKIGNWELVGVARGPVSELASGNTGVFTYAAAELRPTDDGSGFTVVGDAAYFEEAGAVGRLKSFKITRADDKAVAVWWEPEPGAQISAAVLRGPRGGTLEPFSFPEAPALGPVPGSPFEIVALVPRNARAYTDGRVAAGEHSYALALLDRVQIAGGSYQWRVMWLSETLDVVVPESPLAPVSVEAKPPENDDGTHIEVSWKAQEGGANGFMVLRSKTDAQPPTFNSFEKSWSGAWKPAHEEPLPADTVDFKDTVARGSSYHYAVAALRVRDGKIIVAAAGSATPAVSPSADFFNEQRWAVLVLSLLMLLGLLYYVPRVRKDPSSIYIRRIPGVDAIEEAVGRSTEMGRPVLYVTGVENIQNIQTIASLLCLGPVAEMTAEYDTELKVANFEALTMVVAEEIVKQGYANAGRADAHRPENVMFISSEQFAFAAGVNGIILRDKPATNIYLGRFFAESLILAETGYVTKSIQIAGTAEVTQLPFFIAACDYTIIGEELYAVSAYLSRDPKLLATLKASDMLKLVVIITVVLGAVLATFGIYDIGPRIAP